MRDKSILLKLAASARRRHLWNLLLAETVVAASAAMGGAILLLLLGTQILEWYWPVVLFLGGFAIGLYRARRRIPFPYRVMQLIDRRLGLHDSLSTAFYFGWLGQSRNVSPQMRKAQQEEAEQICRTIDARRAVSLAVPRAIYPALALVMVVGSLLGVRYGFQQSLDLRPPIVRGVLDFFRPSPRVASLQKKSQPRLPDDKPIGISVDQGKQEATGLDQADESALNVVDEPDVNNSAQSVASEDPSKSSTRSQNESAENEPEGSESEQSSNGKPEANESSSGDSPSQASKQASPPKAGERASANPQGENSNLLDKMRDAMANLLSRLKIPPTAGDGQRSVSSSRGSPRNSRSQQNSGQPGNQMAGRPQAEGMPNPTGEQQGEGGEQAQAGQGRGGDKSSEQASRQDARSGIGKQDGSKELKDAEIEAAMGKISEIIGRRAANITGEVMMEVASGKQHLRTAYTDKSATHKEAGGEIHRDEVPLLFQHYVQQYFEEVRKSTPAGAEKAPGSPDKRP